MPTIHRAHWSSCRSTLSIFSQSAILVLRFPAIHQSTRDQAKTRWAIIVCEILRYTSQHSTKPNHDGCLRLPPPGYLENLEGEQDAFRARRVGAAMLLRFLNGDPRTGRLTHFCTGCCRTENDSKDNVFAAITQGKLLSGFCTTTPSSSRWGSTTDSAAEQAAGYMFAGILGRSMEKAFAGFETEAKEDDDDVRKAVAARTKRAAEHTNDRQRQCHYIMISWATEAVDHLWLRLQHLDEKQCTLMDLQLPDSPFRVCQRELASLMLQPFELSPLSTVYWFFVGSDEEAGADFAADVRQHVASIISQITWRFDQRFNTWPYRICKLIDVRLPPAERDAEFDMFWNEPECCLDPDFGAKVRRLITSRDGFKCDKAIAAAIKDWSTHTKLCNMQTERLLSLIKKSCPDAKPSVEKICAKGLLTQHLRDHMAAGGEDPRGAANNADLVAAPVSGFREFAVMHP